MFMGVNTINGEMVVGGTARNGTHVWVNAKLIIAIEGSQDDLCTTRIYAGPVGGWFDMPGKPDDIINQLGEA